MVNRTELDEAPKTILAASTGGHLEQLIRLSKRLRPEPSSVVWVTPDEPQSRSLLAGQDVYHLTVRPASAGRPRLANSPATYRLLKHGRYDRVVSTGAAMALSVLAMARARGIPCHWIESSARATGPSLTGRIVSSIPGMHLYTQYPSWADERWAYRGSVLDAYRPVERVPPVDGLARRVVVTFGTQKGYPFRRGLDALLRVLPAVLAPDAEVLWQTGVTDLSGLEHQGQSDAAGGRDPRGDGRGRPRHRACGCRLGPHRLGPGARPGAPAPPAQVRRDGRRPPTDDRGRARVPRARHQPRSRGPGSRTTSRRRWARVSRRRPSSLRSSWRSRSRHGGDRRRRDAGRVGFGSTRLRCPREPGPAAAGSHPTRRRRRSGSLTFATWGALRTEAADGEVLLLNPLARTRHGDVDPRSLSLTDDQRLSRMLPSVLGGPGGR